MVAAIRGLTGAVLVILTAAGAWARPAVLNVRLGVHPEGTRVVLDLSEAPGYRAFTLADPYRVVIDLTEVDWNLPGGRPPAGAGLVEALRFGLFAVGTSRVVLDVRGPVRIRHVGVIPATAGQPVRLVLDLEPVDSDTFRKSLPAGPVLSASVAPPGPPPAAARLPPVKPSGPGARIKRIIVVDPGHGGVDPGTIGISGTMEKTITLAMAKELKKQLEATGAYEVVLTRTRDIFIRLRDRLAIARAAKAALFLSLHTNSSETSSLRGAAVYSLSEEASDEEAAALAAKENKADLIAGVDLSNESEVVTNILIDLAQRETMNLSAHFAGILVGALGRGSLMLPKPHRYADLAVLKAPDVPSVLIELGYLSGAKDEALLRSPVYRAKLAGAIIGAIDDYFDLQESLKKS